ncbi:MAG: RNA polymerase subunit sigma-70, partial [Bacteroides sp.]
MINEDEIREACASNRERGFKLLMNKFQEPIYQYIRRMVV